MEAGQVEAHSAQSGEESEAECVVRGQMQCAGV